MLNAPLFYGANTTVVCGGNMITYKDMTFCAAKCGNKDCHRNTANIPIDDEGCFDTGGLAIAWCDFQPACDNYEALEDCDD